MSGRARGGADRVTKVRLVALIFGIAIAAVGFLITLGYFTPIIERIIAIYEWINRAAFFILIGLFIVLTFYHLLRWYEKN